MVEDHTKEGSVRRPKMISTLGPCRFLYYNNDLLEGLLSRVCLFADDTIIYIAVQCIINRSHHHPPGRHGLTGSMGRWHGGYFCRHTFLLFTQGKFGQDIGGTGHSSGHHGPKLQDLWLVLLLFYQFLLATPRLD